MLNPNSPLAKLMAIPMKPGAVAWMGIRPERHAAMIANDTLSLIAAQGIVGDRYHTRNNGGRQVTLIQAEDLAAIASYLGRDIVEPERLRRNIVSRGINLLALKDKTFRVGDAVLAYSGECHPCSQMETLLETGGYNAVRGRGGITARVLQGGDVRVGDAITVI